MSISSYIKYIIFFSAVFYIAIFSSNATTNKKTQLSDSVRNLINNKHLSDSLRIIHLSELALMDYYLEMDNSNAGQYLSKAQAIASKLDNQDVQVFIYTTKMHMSVEPEDMKLITDSCIFYTKKAKNPQVRFIGWQTLGKMKRNTPLASEYIEKALHEIEGKGYWLQEQSIYYDQIHNCYATVETYPQAIDFAKLSLAAAEKSGNNYIIAKSWSELGIAYLMNYNLTEEDASLLQLAHDSFTRTFDMYKNKTVDISARSNRLLYNTVLINLSNIEIAWGNTSKSILYLKKSLDNSLIYAESDKVDYSLKPYIYYDATQNILHCCVTLGSLYKSLKNYNEAEKYLLGALDFFPKNQLEDARNGNFTSFRIIADLADLYYEIGKYEEAIYGYTYSYERYKEHYIYRIEGIAHHLEKAYEKERTKKELTIIQESLSQSRKNTFLFIILIIFLIVVSILLYFLQRYQLKNSVQKRDLYEGEKKILETLKSKKELESRLNAYQTAKYKKELLTENLLVEHKDKIIEDLRSFFMKNPTLNKYRKELEQILNTDNSDSNEIKDFNTSFQGISHELYNKLQEYADNKLTPLDFKYCHMILMKMSSKEMAEMLHVDTSTIRVNKYRLKQKLKLKKEEDLNAFIEEVNKGSFD